MKDAEFNLHTKHLGRVLRSDYQMVYLSEAFYVFNEIVTRAKTHNQYTIDQLYELHTVFKEYFQEKGINFEEGIAKELLQNFQRRDAYIDTSKEAIIQAMWEQNANRAKEDIETALDHLFDGPEYESEHTPESKYTVHWEKMYQQSQEANTRLQTDNQELNTKMKAIKDMLEYTNTPEIGS